MYRINETNSNENVSLFSKLLIFLVFVLGFLNSKPYFDFMGYSVFPQLLLLIYFILLPLLVILTVMNILFYRKGYMLSSPYWIVLFIGLLIKFFLLYVQFPSTFLPGGENFYPTFTMLLNVLIIFVLVENTSNIRTLRLLIWFFGLGLFFSTVIPIVFFPEYIGLRISEINGFKISGGFWNQSVISFVSAGWLIMFLVVFEKKKILKYVAFTIFITIVLGGMFGLSRATLLSLILSTLVYLFVSNNFRKYIKSIIVIILVSSVVFLVFDDVINNFTERFEGGIDVEEEARVDIWKDYIVNIPDYFMFGELEGNYKKYSSSPKQFGPHSVLLNWLVQFGIISFVGFIYLLYGVFKSSKIIYRYQSREYGAIIFAWLTAYCSVSFINETGFNQITLFIGIGIVLAWGNIIVKENIKHS